jgi:uncharacterized membrane protein YkoI
MLLRLVAILMLALAQAAVCESALAQQNLVDPRGRDSQAAGGISLDQAVRMVESRYRARAVRADVVNQGGKRIYEIRLLNADGKVWKVRVDAETGRSY